MSFIIRHIEKDGPTGYIETLAPVFWTDKRNRAHFFVTKEDAIRWAAELLKPGMTLKEWYRDLMFLPAPRYADMTPEERLWRFEFDAVYYHTVCLVGKLLAYVLCPPRYIKEMREFTESPTLRSLCRA